MSRFPSKSMLVGVGSEKCDWSENRRRWRGAERWSDRDFVLSGEVGPFAQQLALRQCEDTRGLSNQHRVVETIVARSCRDEVAALKTNTRRQRRRKKQKWWEAARLHSLHLQCGHLQGLRGVFYFENRQLLYLTSCAGCYGQNGGRRTEMLLLENHWHTSTWLHFVCIYQFFPWSSCFFFCEKNDFTPKHKAPLCVREQTRTRISFF